MKHKADHHHKMLKKAHKDMSKHMSALHKMAKAHKAGLKSERAEEAALHEMHKYRMK